MYGIVHPIQQDFSQQGAHVAATFNMKLLFLFTELEEIKWIGYISKLV